MASTIAPLSPSPESWTVDKLTKLLGDNRRGADWANRINNLMQWTPLGIPSAGYSAGQMIGSGLQNRSIPQTGLGVGMAALGAVPMLRPEAKAIRAYHGSPHLFDKFDASKIGSGEGAQAFGHGLYFAENPETARSYKYINAKIDPDTVTYAGKTVQAHYDKALRAQDIAMRGGDKAAISKANANAYLWESMMVGNHPHQVLEDAKDTTQGWPELNAAAHAMDMNKFTNVDVPGHMYEVNINADPQHFLDWDKAVSEQPHIAKAAETILSKNLGSDMGHLLPDILPGVHAGTGKDFYKNWLGAGLNDKNAAQSLQNAGVAGIKYLDQGSRDAGEGTRNYVVFNPDIVNIMRRYALPVAAGAAAGTAALAPYQTQQPQY